MRNIGQRSINPSLFPLYFNLGTLLCDLGQLNEAIDVWQKATDLQTDPRALNNFGTCYHRARRFKEAEECFRNAIKLKPDFVEALSNLGCNLADQGRREEAVAVARAALRFNPGSGTAVSHFFLEQRYLYDWTDFSATETKLRELVRAGEFVSPFLFISANTPPEEQLMCARTWAAASLSPHRRKRPPFLPLCAGQGASGLAICPATSMSMQAAFLMAEMLERHDHQRFEIFAYSFSVDDNSATRHRIIAAFDHFIEIGAMPHEAAIRKIREDGIDILVDLKGYTRNARPEIMAGRPAPIQVNYLGYPGTMGADCIDYLIADEFIVPADQQKHFSEKLVYLPHSYQPNDTRRAISARGFARSLFGLPENGFVFCSFNGNSKITPSFFDVWMRLLKNTPGSVLWLLETGSPENLRREAVGWHDKLSASRRSGLSLRPG